MKSVTLIGDSIRKEFDQTTATVPLPCYTENVRSILTRLQSESNTVVIWARTTPVNYEWHHENKPFDHFEEDVVEYNAAAERETRALGIYVNDLFSVVQSAGANTLLTPGGVHFSPEGYALLGAKVADCIRAAIDNHEDCRCDERTY